MSWFLTWRSITTFPENRTPHINSAITPPLPQWGALRTLGKMIVILRLPSIGKLIFDNKQSTCVPNKRGSSGCPSGTDIHIITFNRYRHILVFYQHRYFFLIFYQHRHHIQIMEMHTYTINAYMKNAYIYYTCLHFHCFFIQVPRYYSI